MKWLKTRWVYHTITWLFAYLAFSFLLYVQAQGEDFPLFLEVFYSILPMAIITYAHFYVKERFLNQRQYFWYIIGLFLVIGLGIVLFELLKNFSTFNGNPIFQHIVNAVFIIVLSTGMQYLKRGIVSQYQLQELTAKKTEIELNALKAQMNPHFLFNTLNNIYSINQIDASKGSEMILELSDVMRYHLDSSKKDRINMDQELNLIQAFIVLERLRLHDVCELHVDIDSVDQSLYIAPLILLPFIENAFKHGTHSTKACYLNISLRSEAKNIYFHIENSIISDKQVVKTNIGLENTLRRLELIYPNKHQLTTKKGVSKYQVSLTIDTSI